MTTQQISIPHSIARALVLAGTLLASSVGLARISDPTMFVYMRPQSSFTAAQKTELRALRLALTRAGVLPPCRLNELPAAEAERVQGMNFPAAYHNILTLTDEKRRELVEAGALPRFAHPDLTPAERTEMLRKAGYMVVDDVVAMHPDTRAALIEAGLVAKYYFGEVPMELREELVQKGYLSKYTRWEALYVDYPGLCETYHPR